MKGIQNWTKWIYWFTFSVAVIFVYKTLDNFSDISVWFGKFLSIVMPFILGILFAYLLYIPCKGIENLYKKAKFLQKHARGLSVFTVYIVVLLFVILIMNIVLPALSKSIMDLANNLPTYYNRTIDFVNNMPEDALIGKEDVQEIISNLQKVDITKIFSMEDITDYINGAMRNSECYIRNLCNNSNIHIYIIGKK